jgi:hypothetical protein
MKCACSCIERPCRAPIFVSRHSSKTTLEIYSVSYGVLNKNSSYVFFFKGFLVLFLCISFKYYIEHKFGSKALKMTHLSSFWQHAYNSFNMQSTYSFRLSHLTKWPSTSWDPSFINTFCFSNKILLELPIIIIIGRAI